MAGEACGGDATGVDGNGLPGGPAGGEVIVSLGAACTLADSEASRSVAVEALPLAADRAKGLFLIADPAGWTGTENRFRCELRLAR